MNLVLCGDEGSGGGWEGVGEDAGGWCGGGVGGMRGVEEFPAFFGESGRHGRH